MIPKENCAFCHVTIELIGSLLVQSSASIMTCFVMCHVKNKKNIQTV